MANWGLPTLTSLYTDFLTYLKSRDDDCAVMFDGVTTSNLPLNTIRWTSANNRWEKWNNTTWVELSNKFIINVDTVDGFHASAYNVFTANALVTRNASGHIYTNYISMTADTIASVATRIPIEVSNNKYLRWQTPDQFFINHRAKIKTEYEANSNTNVFTDANKAKLDSLHTEVLLETINVGTQLNIDMTSYITSTYKKYVIEIINLLPANNSEWLNLRVQTGSSTWVTTASYKSEGVSTATNELNLTAKFMSNVAANGGVSGKIEIIDPASSAHVTVVNSKLGRYNGSTYDEDDQGGVYTLNTVVTGLRLLTQSGNNWASGTVKIYGVN